MALRQRARHAPRVRRVAGVRRRGQDDRDRRRDRDVHRQDQQGRRVVRRSATATSCSPGSARTGRTPRRSTPPTGASTPRRSSASSTSVDAQEVRRYFAFDKVRQGLLDVTGRLFGLALRAGRRPDLARRRHGVRRRRWPASGSAGSTSTCTRAPTSSTTPRSSRSTDGVAGRQLPEGVLVCNFPRGLMEHDDVVTLFHEFGHLVHHVLGGHQRWARFAGVATEWDFVEAPSQMLEEWAWDADGAARASPPTTTARRSRPTWSPGCARRRTSARASRRAPRCSTPRCPTGSTRSRRPTAPPSARCHSELQAAYSMVTPLPDTHFHAAFGHLDGYSSGYYTYMWSLVIAKDLFSAFDRDDLFDAEVAAPLPRPDPRPGRSPGRRRPGRGLPRPALRLRVVRDLAGGVGAATTADRLVACVERSPSTGRRSTSTAAGAPRLAQLIGWWMTARKRSMIARSPARWVSAPSPRRQMRASSTSARAADHRVRLDAGVGDHVEVVLVVVDAVGVGAVEVAQLHPDPVVGVGEVDADVVGERRELAPGRAPAVHHVEHLVDAVGSEVGRERRERVGGQLGVAAVDQGLVGLAAQDEGDVLVLGVPGPGLVGRVRARPGRRPARRTARRRTPAARRGRPGARARGSRRAPWVGG